MSIKHTIRGGAARLRPALFLSLAMIWVVGCATPRPGVSRLAGTWEAVDAPGDQLVIQPDGTLDLTHTMLGAIGGLRNLRQVGDAVDLAQVPFRLEVERAEYTATRSYVLIRQTPLEELDEPQAPYVQFLAELTEAGTLLLRFGAPESPAVAPESLASRVYERVGDAPPVREPPAAPPEPQDEWIALGRRHFAGENWFNDLRVERLSGADSVTAILLRHRDEQLARRFLVVRVKAPPTEFVESALTSSAADAAKLRCSVLFIALPELAPYGRPADETVARLADMVEGLSREAIERVGPAACGLETVSNATYVGHYLWQRHAVPFGGWFCWHPENFRWYGSSSSAVRRAPILLLQGEPRPREYRQEEYNSVRAEYLADGFEDVRLLRSFSEDRSTVNFSQRSIRELAKAAGAGDLE
jgi:hypothetical protein